MAEELRDRDLFAVYSSDLKRARYGGEALVRERGLELRIEPALRELFFGDWEGMSYEEIEQHRPGAMLERMKNIVHYRPPGGETIGELAQRVGVCVSRLLAEHQGQEVAIVAHSGVNRSVILQALGCPLARIWRLDQDFGCLNIVEYFEDGFAMVRLANGQNRADVSKF